MQTVKIVVWEQDGWHLGYLLQFPEYWTQGENLDDLKDHLRDLYIDLSSETTPPHRRVEDLVVSARRSVLSCSKISLIHIE